MIQTKLVKNRDPKKFEEELNNALKEIQKYNIDIVKDIKYSVEVIQFPNDFEYDLEYSALIIYGVYEGESSKEGKEEDEY